MDWATEPEFRLSCTKDELAQPWYGIPGIDDSHQIGTGFGTKLRTRVALATSGGRAELRKKEGLFVYDLHAPKKPAGVEVH